MDEFEIIKKLKDGDEKAFVEFFNYYFERIFNYIYKRVKMREVAEDLTSETFLKFIKSLKNFEIKEGYHLDTWMYAIARNNMRDWFRQNLGHDVLPLEEKFEKAYHPILYDVYGSYTVEDVDQIVNLALSKLPEDYRKVLLMRFYERKSIKEIALVLGKTENVVKVTQFRGLKRLKEIIEELLNG